jgi:hypothetical protein
LGLRGLEQLQNKPLADKETVIALAPLTPSSVLPKTTLHEPALPLSIKILRILSKSKGGDPCFFIKKRKNGQNAGFCRGVRGVYKILK